MPLQSNRNPPPGDRSAHASASLCDACARPTPGTGLAVGVEPSRFPAVAAEPPGPGLARARDPLRREVRLLGALLGQVIAEQAGPDLFALVERVRRRTIALRRTDPDLDLEPDAERAQARGGDRGAGPRPGGGRRQGVHALLPARQPRRGAAADPRAAHARARGPAAGPIDDSVGEAVDRLARTRGRAGRRELLARTSRSTRCSPPTLPRRAGGRCSIAQRRVRRLLDALDDPHTTPDEDADLRRRLREEISLLWHTGEVRSVAPTPLDEVRSELAIFDETLFIGGARASSARWTGRSTRRRHGAGTAQRARIAADAGRTGTRPGRRARAAPVRVVDRGGPRRPPRRHARRHAPRRAPPGGPPAPRLRGRRPAADADGRGARGAGRRGPGARPRARRRTREELPETMRQLRRRFPEEPYRAAAGRDRGAGPAHARGAHRRDRAADRRLRATAEALDAELAVVQHALVGGRARPGRVGRARRPALAGRDVRVPPRLARGAPARGRPPGGARGARRRARGPNEAVGGGVTLGEVLATFRAIARLQARFGVRACQRYVISFTTSPEDVMTVLELARRAARAGAVRASGAGPRRPAGRAAACSTSSRCSSRPTRSSGADALLDRLLARPRRTARHLRDPRRRPGGDARLLRLVARRAGSSPRTGSCTGRRRRWSAPRGGTGSR